MTGGHGFQREPFFKMFKDGLIYRGHRVIHWCPRCLTSLSDEEAEFHGEFVDFDPLWSYPKPLQDGGPPVWIGANSNIKCAASVPARAPSICTAT